MKKKKAKGSKTWSTHAIIGPKTAMNNLLFDRT